jgi:hypothetical protein
MQNKLVDLQNHIFAAIAGRNKQPDVGKKRILIKI